jgi:hypothetical protein
MRIVVGELENMLKGASANNSGTLGKKCIFYKQNKTETKNFNRKK